MASVSPVTLIKAGATVQKTSSIVRITRGDPREDEELQTVNVNSRKNTDRRSSKRSDDAFKPNSPQATISGAVLAVLHNFKLGG